MDRSALSREELLREIERVEKINRALMDRVERGMNLQNDAFSFFQAASMLETKVRERTQALHSALENLALSNEKLEEARRSAEAASRAKSEFLANMSHEIRTPINGAMGMAELLLSTNLTDRQRRFATTIKTSGESLLAIINDILDLTKVEAGKLEVHATSLDPGEMLEEVVSLFAERAQRKGLELTSIVPNEPALWMVDATRLRQILTNLLGNAIKFTATGDVATKLVDAEVDPETGQGVLRFEVRDTGVGIDPSVQTTIFDAFQQADSSTTKEYGGTGLGLAISSRLAHLMGGEIGVESRVGHGSTFWFTIRATRCEAQPAQGDLEDELLRSRRVLIVDDSSTSREVLDQHLGRWGCEVSSAKCEREALVVLRSAVAAGRPFEIVIVDRGLAGVDGVQLISHITREPDLHADHVVLLDSLDIELDDEMLRAVGVGAQLTKPVRRSTLRECLLGLLGHEPSLRVGERAEEHEMAASLAAAVLLVEDNPINQEVAIGLLEELGCRVEVVGDGHEAVATFAEHRFDLIFMDCQMPRMDGFEATRAIRRFESSHGRARTPIVAITANALQGDRERCLGAGMDDYLAKPFTSEELRERVQRWASGAVCPSSRAEVHGALRDGASGASAAPEELGAIDDAALEVLRRLEAPGRAGIVRKVITLFLEESRSKLKQLDAALARGDIIEVGRVAHGLKSCSGNVGARVLAGLLGRVEQAARSGRESEIRCLVPSLAESHAAAVEVLEKELELCCA